VAEILDVLSVAAYLVRAARVVYTGYSNVKELHNGSSPGASQVHLASSSRMTSSYACTRLVDGTYILYALDPSSYPIKTIRVLLLSSCC
jgi:hypothetical protein